MIDSINTDYPYILTSLGVPYRLKKKGSFSLKAALKPYAFPDDSKVIPVSKQVENYNVALNVGESGWLAYICANSILDRAKNISASIMAKYIAEGKNVVWLSNVDNVKNINFPSLKLVVIDALFFDSSPYRRDKVYELINYNCNIPDLSVIVIGQNTDPIAMSNQLGMKPNLTMLTK